MNLHNFPVKITVLDAVPFLENTAIAVERLVSTTPPGEKFAGDKRGVIAWTYEYAPKEAREIRLGYRMKWLGDRDVMIEAVPLSAR